MYKNDETETVLNHRLGKGNIVETKTPHNVHQHSENISTISSTDNESASSKPNQVGTVLLYGVPIVSLYIEGQERLCLAQISNTLLKRFSYNEIHNRRVALGITCVQCTPVQLEILRRAGAMPVSSRRCGMITRREAERLCKSFLGDNAPPRLPEDFSFNVYHECAWGCRGQFLPSRYNSSRAKCIKCAYCGLFFSPNKFIFHSHRIGPGDKYVQPDAANFNSWRRHMKLSGISPEEIVFAWEDVKAMFNGGTRKRLVSSVSSKVISAPNNGGSGGVNTGHTNINSNTQNNNNNNNNNNNRSAQHSPKRLKESTTMEHHSQQPLSPPLMQAAVAAALSAAQQYPIVHSSKLNSNCSRLVNATALCSNPMPRNTNAIPSDITPSIQLSRNFVMDYMWHSQQQQQQQHSAYGLPWLKQPSAHIFFNHQTSSFHHGHQHNNLNTTSASQLDTDTDLKSSTSRRNSHDRIVSPTAKPYSPNSTSMQYYKNSAFRPVLASHRAQLFNENVFNASLLTASNSASNNRCDESTASNFNNDNEFKYRNKRPNNRRSESVNDSPSLESQRDSVACATVENLSSDDEMVDIETTEENSLTAHSMQRSLSNHSNNSVIDESCDPAVIVVNENDGITQLGSAANGIESMKLLLSGPDYCAGGGGSNNNNNFLSNNNNNNSLDTNSSHKMIHKSDVNVNLSANADQMTKNGSNQCLNEFGMIKQQQQSLMHSASEQKVIHSNANIDIVGECVGGGSDNSNIDKHSTKSNSSQIEIDVEIQDEKDEEKPILNSLTILPTILVNNSNSGWNDSDKLVTDTIQLYSNCETDSSSIDGATISDKIDSAILKKEGKNKTNHPSNHPGDFLNRRIEKVTALNLSKAEEVFGPNDLKFSPTATTPYDKLDIKWRSSPKASSPTPLESRIRKSPSTIQSNPNLLFTNRMHQMNQFYPRPSPFHAHPQHHSLSKHFHYMLNQHTNLLQNNSIAFDRASMTSSLNLANITNYNHAHSDVITSTSLPPHHSAHD